MSCLSFLPRFPSFLLRTVGSSILFLSSFCSLPRCSSTSSSVSLQPKAPSLPSPGLYRKIKSVAWLALVSFQGQRLRPPLSLTGKRHLRLFSVGVSSNPPPMALSSSLLLGVTRLSLRKSEALVADLFLTVDKEQGNGSFLVYLHEEGRRGPIPFFVPLVSLSSHFFCLLQAVFLFPSFSASMSLLFSFKSCQPQRLLPPPRPPFPSRPRRNCLLGSAIVSIAALSTPLLVLLLLPLRPRLVFPSPLLFSLGVSHLLASLLGAFPVYIQLGMLCFPGVSLAVSPLPWELGRVLLLPSLRSIVFVF